MATSPNKKRLALAALGLLGWIVAAGVFALLDTPPAAKAAALAASVPAGLLTALLCYALPGGRP